MLDDGPLLDLSGKSVPLFHLEELLDQLLYLDTILHIYNNNNNNNSKFPKPILVVKLRSRGLKRPVHFPQFSPDGSAKRLISPRKGKDCLQIITISETDDNRMTVAIPKRPRKRRKPNSLRHAMHSLISLISLTIEYPQARGNSDRRRLSVNQ